MSEDKLLIALFVEGARVQLDPCPIFLYSFLINNTDMLQIKKACYSAGKYLAAPAAPLPGHF
jgi:hypothetical protein